MTEHDDNAPVPNIPLLRKAVEWVEMEAEKPWMEREWSQGNWYTTRDEDAQSAGWCGTACCVAGWVGLQSEMAQPQIEHDVYGNEMFTDRMEYLSGVVVHVSDYAQHALGLTAAQADELFAGGNDARDIRRIAEAIAGEAL